MMLIPQSRPFGVALLIAGIDEKGPQLSASSNKTLILTLELMKIDITLILLEHLHGMKPKLLEVVQTQLNRVYKMLSTKSAHCKSSV